MCESRCVCVCVREREGDKKEDQARVDKSFDFSKCFT